MQKDYTKLYPLILYDFKDPNLLILALSHPSLCYSKKKECSSYQRLEFLGDSVLSLVVIESLFEMYPQSSEGDLAKRKSYLVSSKVLAEISKKIGLGEFIYMTNGEEKMNGRNSQKILEDVIESIIGAIYLDGGLENARKFILEYWLFLITSLKIVISDPKTRLQEWAQRYKSETPKYEIAGDNENLNNFKIFVEITGINKIIGEGKNKKNASIKAAEGMINYIKQHVDKDI